MAGGETEDKPSAFTVDSLSVHLISIMNERDRRYEQRFASQEQALSKQEDTITVRFATVNEFRAQLADQATRFMPRLEAEQRTQQNTDRISQLDRRLNEALGQVNSRLDLTAGRSSGFDKGWGYLVGAVGTALAIVAIVIALFQK